MFFVPLLRHIGDGILLESTNFIWKFSKSGPQYGMLAVVPDNIECRPQNTFKWIELSRCRPNILCKFWLGLFFRYILIPDVWLRSENWYRNWYRILIELDILRPRANHYLNAVLRHFGTKIHLFTRTRMRTQLSRVCQPEKKWMLSVICPDDHFPTSSSWPYAFFGFSCLNTTSCGNMKEITVGHFHTNAFSNRPFVCN